MLFRIEDNQNVDSCHREYANPIDRCPQMPMSELENYIAEEIRKEVNNASSH